MQAHVGFRVLGGTYDFAVFSHGDRKTSFECGFRTEGSNYAVQVFQFQRLVKKLSLGESGKFTMQLQGIFYSSIQDSSWVEMIVFEE